MSDLLRREPHVISAGLRLLAEAAVEQAARVTQVDWAPPMAGAEDDLVAVLGDPRRNAANAVAVQRMLAVRAHLVDVMPARTALDLQPGEFLHAGPPVSWERAAGPLRGALMGALVLGQRLHIFFTLCHVPAECCISVQMKSTPELAAAQ